MNCERQMTTETRISQIGDGAWRVRQPNAARPRDPMAPADCLSGDHVDRAWRGPCAQFLISATFAQAIYHKGPDELGGRYFAHVRGGDLRRHSFRGTVRVQKLSDPNRLMVWDDQARSVLAA